METVIETALLKKAFMKLTKFQTSTKHTTDTMRLAVEDGEVIFSIYSVNPDARIQASITLPALSTLRGVTFFPFKKLHNLIKKTKDTTMTFTDTTVANSKSVITFDLQDVTYPVYSATTEKTVTLPKDDFKMALTKVSYPSLTAGEARPILSAINLSVDDTIMTMTSTDSQRLAQYRADVTASDGSLSLSVSAKMLNKLITTFEKNATDIVIGLADDKSYASYQFDDMHIFMSLMEGNYPDVTRLLEISELSSFSFESSNLHESIDLAMATTDLDANNRIQLHFETDKLIVDATDKETTLVSNVAVADFLGEPTMMTFNAKYLADALKALDGTTHAKLQGRTRAMFFLSLDGKEQHLILPIRTVY